MAIVEVPYYLSLFVLALFGLHRAWLLARALRGRSEEEVPRPSVDWPRVTVQLPIYNERFVARRILRSAAGMDYPSDRLTIQVLDDSTDDTSEDLAREVEELCARGVRIDHIRRTDRRGFKAGALAAALPRAEGDFLAIFDADFIPPPDFLKKLLPLFDAPEIGMVQARWAHRNEGASLLTSAQALMLDGHFDVEQRARSNAGLFFNFNGTAGIWRREAIDSAGGWGAQTLTEDLDLSYRAQLKGWRFRYAGEVLAPAELPERMAAFKTQQHRWAKGSAQTARRLLPQIFRAPIGIRRKLEAGFHLTNNAAYVALALFAACFPAAHFLRAPGRGFPARMGDLLLLFLSLLSVGAFFLYPQVQKRGWMAAFARLGLMVALGVGISINNARAVLEGWFGSTGEFVRTPKRGDPQGLHSGGLPYVVPIRLGTILLEGVFAIYFAAALGVFLWEGRWESVPFLAIFLAGYSMVLGMSLRESSGSGKQFR